MLGNRYDITYTHNFIICGCLRENFCIIFLCYHLYSQEVLTSAAIPSWQHLQQQQQQQQQLAAAAAVATSRLMNLQMEMAAAANHHEIRMV
jgi:hypothetical protein